MREPITPLSKIRTTPASTPGGTKVREEKILVTVRVRPLSPRELAMYDLIAWECPDEQTIIFKSPSDERPSSSFTFGMATSFTNFLSFVRSALPNAKLSGLSMVFEI